MFGQRARLYTYLSHGIHVCVNVVIAHDGVAGAVLYEPLRYGTEPMWPQSSRRPSSQAGIARGPAIYVRRSKSRWQTTRLISAASRSDSAGRPDRRQRGPQVGVSKAADRPCASGWRTTPKYRPTGVVLERLTGASD